MSKKITKLMAALALLLFMTPAMKVIAMDDGYTIGTTPLSSVSNGDLVVWGTSNSNLAKSCSSNWIYLSSTQSEWIVFTVETTTNGFYLKTPEGSYVYSSAAKKVEFSSTNKTVLTINSNNLVNGGSSIGNYTYNSTGIRPYASNNYTNAYLYAVTPSGSIPTTYTVTYDAGDGTGTMSDPNSPYEAGAIVTLLTNSFTAPTGYEWSSWDVKDASNNAVTVSNNQFTMPASNVTVTAQYTQSGGSGTATATLTQSNLELTGSYTTDTEKTIDGITYVYTDLMKSNSNIQAKASSGTIKNTTAYPGDIISVVITHYGTARATTINGSADGTNWTQVATGSGSITADFSGRGYKYFQITRGSNAAYWSGIDITYSTSSSSQSQSDLAITNTSTDLTFDLYNNATAQVINYTTSSTGAVTVTPASPTTYFSYVHDATAKTITVTPLAVTPSAQTVTISQEADENYYPGTTTFTVSVTNSDPNMPGSFNNPYTVAQARAAIDANSGVTGVYATGIVSENNYFSSNNGYITYFISADGSTESDQLEAFHGMNFNGAVFTSADDIQVGDSVVIYGNLMKYHNNNTNTDVYEFESGNQLVFLKRPTPVLESYDLTVSALNEHINAIYVFDAADENNPLIADGLAGTVQVLEGTDIIVSPDVEEGYVLQSLTVLDDEGESVQPENHMSDGGYYSFTMPSGNVTITAIAVEEVVPPTPADGDYVRITSLDQLTDGSIVIIAARYDENTANGYYAMPNTLTSGKANGVNFTSMSSDGNEILPASIVNDEEDYYWTVNVTENGYTFTNADGDMIGYGTSGTNFIMNSTKTEWTITRETADVTAMVAEYTGFVIRNYTTDARAFAFNGTLFGAYATTNMTAAGYNFFLDFFVQASEPTPVTIPLSINAWTTVDGIPGNWYLITSPLKDSIDDPNDVTNMISDTPTNYDLYRFDQAAGFEWINYKDQNFDVNPNFGSLEAGTGYLYANANTVQLQFTGTPYSGTGEFPLAYSESNSDVNMRGWNLVGNPFTVEASVDHTYYRMNENRTDIMVGTGNVAAMEGVFVRASSTNTNQNVKFTRSAKATNSVEQTVIDLSRNNAVIDRAIISFGEDEPLPKIQLNQNNTKIYFMMENGAYAVVIGSYQAELPLNFKAATAGTYTLSFTNQNAEFDVLTLIDNQTNTQVDMLANPSYSFSAQTTDDVERFTVVYERAASYLTIGTGDLYSASGNNSTDSTKDGMGSPVGNTYYTASTAQFIYTASEMEGAKTIKSLAFYHNNQGPFIGTVKIYLDHTSASAVHTGSPATSGTLVYEGTNINIGSTSAGWQTFTLDTPFQYNGTDNLLVVVCRTKATSGNPNYHSDQGWKYTSYSQHYYYMQRSGNSNDTYGNIATTGNYARGFKRPNIKIGYTAPVINHFYLDIDGWTTNRNNYYLIASPIGQVAPTAVDNMLSNTYDLFYFDQDGDEVGYEWITYKPGNGATDPEFNLVPGKGYLYANSGVAGNDPNVVTLTFTGWGYTGSGQVDLIYSEANSDPNMWGWNLVGNPFGVEAYIDRPFYRMNEDGSELKSESETGSIGVMEGVFVHATQNETMTFTTTSNSKGSMVALNLSKDRKVIDRAIVRFGEGKQLPKLQLDKNSTKLYISQDNKDYALVSAEEQGEMPVSFKAEDNGTYNLNFSSENVEFAYLHLIDNMTGTDVDLLQTPNYSFEAKTTDYESRFKLVFATGDNSKEDNFAFFSNGSFVINNEGNATLQVIDVTGRIIKCESINGCANVNMNAALGVYMLRLINGDNVKVQKVVVR